MTTTVHTDRYDPGAFEQDLDNYDARRAAITTNTWSADKTRMYSTQQRHSFGTYVRDQGFALR